MQLATAMMAAPGESLPKQCDSWSDLKAGYRFFSNERGDPHAIQAPHRARTLAACDEHPLVLCVQDTTDLDLTSKAAMHGRGPLGGGTLSGLLQHSALAVVPGEVQQDDSAQGPLDHGSARLLGVLHQQWAARTEAPADETLRQLQQRRTDADVWQETAAAVAQLGSTSARLVHVGDRHCDIFRFFDHCRRLDHGFVVRARYDRALVDAEDQQIGRLFDTLGAQPPMDRQSLTVHEQRTAKGKTRCPARQASLEIRFAPVALCAPANDPRTDGAPPMDAYAVMIEECDSPADQLPLQWVLLTSEPVHDVADAWRIVRYYRHRWLIEEWHRALKEGCRVEAAQFDHVMDVQRLAAIKGVIAVRLLQVRDLSEQAGDDAQQLQREVPRLWIEVVAALAKIRPSQLTPKQFYLTIAKRGGYLARKHDARPGWKVLWRGWTDIHLMVQGVEFMHGNRCG